MRSRIARGTLALYPLAFRRRYGQEMQALVDDQPVRLRSLVDLLRGALAAHLRPTAGLVDELDEETRLRLGLSGVLACWVVFAVAGFAFYNATEDHPFSAAGHAHAVLGGVHRTIAVLALLASAGVLAGALPPIAAALTRARREHRRLGVPVRLPLTAAVVFAIATTLLVVLAHSDRSQYASAFGQGAFIVWGISGIACAAVCVVAGRRALFTLPVARSWLVRALLCATLVSAAMLAIALATALYAIALPIDAANLAGEPDGPFQLITTSVSLIVALIVMSACGALAVISARRAWAALGTGQQIGP